MKNILSLAAALTMGTVALAGGNPTAAPTAYKVDPKASSINWVAKKVTGEHAGTVNFKSGVVDIDAKTKALTGGTFDVDMTSIICTDIKDAETNGKFIGHIKSEDFFSVEKHQNAIFKITSVKKTGKDAYQVTGNLTIKGVTKPNSFPATVTWEGDKLIAKATMKIDRTAYDIKYGSGKFFSNLGDKMINDDFELNLNVEAGK